LSNLSKEPNRTGFPLKRGGVPVQKGGVITTPHRLNVVCHVSRHIAQELDRTGVTVGWLIGSSQDVGITNEKLYACLIMFYRIHVHEAMRRLRSGRRRRPTSRIRTQRAALAKLRKERQA
jgi:hypothetical protein